MKIGLDLMGGDFAPLAVLEGIKLSRELMTPGVELCLIGNINFIKKNHNEIYKDLLKEPNISFVNAADIITMSDSPTKIFSQKPDSSLCLGFNLLNSNQIDVFIGAGNTGAMMVGAIYTVKAIEGVLRPTILSVLPKFEGKFNIILDVGVNSDVRQDVLFQFGLLGSVYMKLIHGIENPKVGLLNIGSEKEKGNLMAQAAYALMENTDKYNFVGNIEGYDLFFDKADVIVTDGFTGNVVLKTLEGVYRIIRKRQIKDDYFKMFNYENYGGTPILGINKPVIVGHGVSTPIAFMNMIKLAKTVLENKMVEEIKTLFTSQINI
jgi:phosphate acyltransferase